MDKKGRLILLRHGESVWNLANIFTGWVNVPLSENGVKEAMSAGEKIKDFTFDAVYTSNLVRAQMTAYLAMTKSRAGQIPLLAVSSAEEEQRRYAIHSDAAKKKLIPMIADEALNERNYGDLQGCDKEEVKAKLGEELFKKYRRGYHTPPPNGESLEMTVARALPYFEREIVPRLAAGETILISAHGNSLRAIVMQLDGLSEDEVVGLEIPTGEPIYYTYENQKWQKKQLGAD